LRKCRAKLQNTTESWISAIFFTMNLVKFFCLNLINVLFRGPAEAVFYRVWDSIAAIYRMLNAKTSHHSLSRPTSIRYAAS
jgi:hypothetical protein